MCLLSIDFICCCVNRSSSIGRKGGSLGNMMVHSWYASTAVSAKAMWTMAISQHQFYLDKKKAEVHLKTIKSITSLCCC